MSTNTRMSFPARQLGFTLVELMVTVAIATFLLAGLFTIVQNVSRTYKDQQALAMLQDQQRFAMTVITDSIQAAGYFPDPTLYTTATFPAAGAFGAGWVFAGSHSATPAVPDTLSTRFEAKVGYGPILCNGTDTSQAAGPTLYTVTFSVVPGNPGALQCSVNGGAAVTLITGVQNLQVYYGVKHDTTQADFNVDTYEQWTVLAAAASDWNSVSSIRVVLTFTNPLFGRATQPQYIVMERVIEVMNRGGMHT